MKSSTHGVVHEKGVTHAKQPAQILGRTGIKNDRSQFFLNHSYNDPTQVEQRKTLGTWVVDDLYYGGFKKFLKLFENYDDRHIDYGNGMLYYKNKMAYPIDIDPKQEYLQFIEFQLQNLPIRVTGFSKAWGVKYPPGGYSGLHSLFLDDNLQVYYF